MRGTLAASRSPRPRITAPARVVASRGRYFGLARNARSEGPAESRVATPVSGALTSPIASPPSCATMSRRVRAAKALWEDAPRPRTNRGSSPMSFIGEGLDDLVGDVDAPAREDRLLDD